MGQLIALEAWVGRRRPPHTPPFSGAARTAPVLGSAEPQSPQFLYDLSCPLSYLAAEQIERRLGQLEWVPVSSARLGPSAVVDVEAIQAEAEQRAGELRLPLVWPDRYPERVTGALRAATYAAGAGFGARFGLAALRLAFCGGFDLEHPRSLAEAAAAAGIGIQGCLAATLDPAFDKVGEAAAEHLTQDGVTTLPAIRVGDQVFTGTVAVVQAEAAVSAVVRGVGRPQSA